MCPYGYTNISHRCNFQYYSSSSGKKHFLYQHSITASSPKMDHGDANTSLELDNGGQRDFRRACVFCSKHMAAFKSQLVKAKPLFGRKCVTASHLQQVLLWLLDTKDTLILHLRTGKNKEHKVSGNLIPSEQHMPFCYYPTYSNTKSNEGLQ